MCQAYLNFQEQFCPPIIPKASHIERKSYWNLKNTYLIYFHALEIIVRCKILQNAMAPQLCLTFSQILLPWQQYLPRYLKNYWRYSNILSKNHHLSRAITCGKKVSMDCFTFAVSFSLLSSNELPASTM